MPLLGAAALASCGRPVARRASAVQDSLSGMEALVRYVGEHPDDVDSAVRLWGVYTRRADFDRLIEHARPFYVRAFRNGNRRLGVYAGCYIGQAYVLSDRPDSMFRYFNEIASDAEELGEPVPLMIVNNGLGIHYLNTAFSYSEALSYFLRALEDAERHGDENNYNIILCNITRAYYMRGDPAGLDYALQAYDIGHRSGNRYVAFFGALNAAYMYYLTHDYDSALRYVEEASVLWDHTLSSTSPDVVHGNILAAMGNGPQAEHYLREAVEHPRKTDITTRTEAYLSYGEFLCSAGRYAEAVDTFMSGIRLAESHGNNFYKHRLYKGLSDTYSCMGQPSRALEYYKLSRTLYDSVFNVEKERMFGNLRLRYESERQKRLMDEKELELVRESHKLQVTVFILIIVLLVLAATYILYTRKNAMYRRLVKQYESYVKKDKALPASGATDSTAADAKSRELFGRLEELVRTDRIYRAKDMSVEKLAELLGTNRSYVSRMFTRCAGVSFNGYFNSLRMAEAVSVLSDVNDDTPLKVLSDRLGYTSLSSFYRAFQRETGVPPSRYRQEAHRMYRRGAA